jgi:tryptophan synthase alpha subunit
MSLVVKFMIVFVFAGIVVSGASLIWPKLTKNPRPEPLTQLRDAIVSTQTGKDIAQALGVSDESKVEQMNIASVAGIMVSTVATQIQQKAEEAATREVIVQVVKKIETLAPDQQEAIRKEICQ